jgi:hypothetical protein
MYEPPYSPVDADPYSWPYGGALDADRTALVCID